MSSPMLPPGGGGGGRGEAHTVLTSEDADAVGWLRLKRYHEFCDRYKVLPMAEVTVAFRYASVTCLQLSPDFSSKDLPPLADMLRYDNVIRELDAHKAKALGNSACYALAVALAENSTLVEVNLSYQDIGEHGAVALAVGLERSKSLQRVFLRGNRIGVTGASALARVLRKTRSIVYMDVSNNYLRVRGVHEITRALLSRAQARLAARWAAASQFHLHQNWVRNGRVVAHNMPPEGEGGEGGGGGGLAAAQGVGHEPDNGEATAPPPRPQPVTSLHVGAGIGWMWGEASDLVVSSNYVVRTNFGRSWKLPTPPQALGKKDSKGSEAEDRASSPTARWPAGSTRSRRGGGMHTGMGIGGHAQGAAQLEGQHGRNHDGVGGAGEQQRHRGRSRSSSSTGSGSHGGHGGSTSSGGDEEGEDVDIEVRISGNFVSEEVFNSVVHGLGLVLACIGAFPLLSRANSASNYNQPAPLLGAIAYIIGLIAFFASSTLNHSLFLTDASAVFRLIDHSAVFLLIAGTYTPFLLQNFYLMQPLSTGLLVVVWVLAAVGVAVSTMFRDVKAEFPSQSTSGVRIMLYMGMGYVGVVPFFLLYSCMDPVGWFLLAVGGCVFSFGVILYWKDKRSNVHELHNVWYVFVLFASLLHWVAVYSYAHAPVAQCMPSDTAVKWGLVWPLPGAE